MTSYTLGGISIFGAGCMSDNFYTNGASNATLNLSPAPNPTGNDFWQTNDRAAKPHRENWCRAVQLDNAN